MTDPKEFKKALRFFILVVATLGVALSAFPLWQKFSSVRKSSGLAIENLRFAEYEGGNPASRPYRAGDDVYLALDVNPLDRGSDGRVEALVTLQPFDPNGLPLQEPTSSILSGSEPRSSVSYHFTLPLYALGGLHKVRIEVEDRVGNRKVSGNAEFPVTAPQIASGTAFGLRDHVFMETEGGPPMAEAIYRPGMKIRTGFRVVGFRLSPQNRMKLRVDLGILSESGESWLDQPGVVSIDQELFYPALYLPVTTSLRSPDGMPTGTYRVKYTLHDGVSGEVLNFEEPFTIRH